MPLDRRSIVPTVPGLPWWGVVLLALGLTSLGLVVDAVQGTELTAAFSTFYFLGCVLAAAAASNRALFTAMVQPPLILFVGVPLGQSLIAKERSTALKDVAINVAYPLVNRFPVMLAATVLVLIVGGVRLFLLQQRTSGPAPSAARNRPARSGRTGSSVTTRSTRTPSKTTAPRNAASKSPVPKNAVAKNAVAKSAAPKNSDRARSVERGQDYPGAPSRRSTASDRRPPASGPVRAPAAGERATGARTPADRAQDAPATRRAPRSRAGTDAPAHPIPQVRYRDRYEPSVEQEPPR